MESSDTRELQVKQFQEALRTAVKSVDALYSEHFKTGIAMNGAIVNGMIELLRDITRAEQSKACIETMKSQGCCVSEDRLTAGIDVQTESDSATERLRAKYPNGQPKVDGSFISNRGRMHVTEFLANLSKLFDSNPSIEGNVFLSVDKDLNVVPDKSVNVFTVIKCQFKSNVGLQKASSKD